MIKEQAVSVLAMFATDEHGIPQIAVAKRLDGVDKGDFALPGGKKDWPTHRQTMVEEVLQETGVQIPPDARVRRIKTPIRFDLRGTPIAMRLYYGGIFNIFAQYWSLKRTESEKLSPWEWMSLTELGRNSKKGKFPKPVYDKIVYASQVLGVRWVGGMTAAEYDWPFWPYHTHPTRALRRLRQGAGLYNR